jgi:hypothetical protein
MDCVVIHITHREARIIAWPGVEMPRRVHLLMAGEATAYEADVVAAAGCQVGADGKFLARRGRLDGWSVQVRFDADKV